jgi:hypothetical protein
MLLEIDETRFKRSSIQYQFAMMMNPQNSEEDLEEINESTEPIKSEGQKA